MRFIATGCRPKYGVFVFEIWLISARLWIFCGANASFFFYLPVVRELVINLRVPDSVRRY